MSLRWLIAVSLLLASVSPFRAEKAGDSAAASALQWDWQQSQELGPQQSIARSKSMPEPERRRLLSAITAQLKRQDCDSDDELRASAVETRIKYVDLNRDGQAEVVAQAGGEHSGCSPTGNCPFWIFRRVEDKYELLLFSKAQTFTIQSSRRNSFSDVLLSRHSSAFESELRTYKFDGERYLESGCYYAEWQQMGSDGEYHRLERPVITPCGAR